MRVAAELRLTLEQVNLVLPRHQIGGSQPTDAPANHRDPHDGLTGRSRRGTRRQSAW